MNIYEKVERCYKLVNQVKTISANNEILLHKRKYKEFVENIKSLTRRVGALLLAIGGLRTYLKKLKSIYNFYIYTKYYLYNIEIIKTFNKFELHFMKTKYYTENTLYETLKIFDLNKKDINEVINYISSLNLKGKIKYKFINTEIEISEETLFKMLNDISNKKDFTETYLF